MRTLAVDTTPPLSVIGLGTWQFGSRAWGYGEDYAVREAGAIVRRALDLGVTLIDSAEVYAFGRSERIVGEAIAGRREEAFLATKLWPAAPIAPVVEQRGRGSARRLGVERIDLYQLHFPNPIVPLSMTMEGIRRLQDAGVVAEVGVSNIGLAGWRAAERLLGRRVLSNQVPYSLVHRAAERDLLGFAAGTDHVVIAHSPLAQGLLSARYDAANRPGGMRAARTLFLPENLDRAKPLLDVLREVAAGHQVTPAQVALAWVIRHPNVVAIPGASSVAQLESNAAAAELGLTDDEAAALEAASDAFVPLSGAGAVGSAVSHLLGSLRR